MSKQLRIWLFVLLSTLLASNSLLAEGVISLTTTQSSGETIYLTIQANGDITIEGVQEAPRLDESRKPYTLTGHTVTIRGDVTAIDCSYNIVTNLEVSGCTSLTTIHCQQNLLDSLDVSGCTP